MRTRLVLVVASLIALLSAVEPFAPITIRAASPALHVRQPSITGTLVAAPQLTRPTTLLLQVGGQTLPVTITDDTRITNRASGALGLGDLHDGDTLQVIGAPNESAGITASLIEDLSTPVPPPPTSLEVKGTLAATPTTLSAPPSGVLCLANARVASTAITSQVATVSPCPAGQLPVYLTNSTRIVRRYGEASGLDELRAGDMLQVDGMFINTQFTASLVKDISIQTAYTALVGTVQSVAANGSLTNVTVLVTKNTSGNAPFAIGVQLMLPLTNAGSPNCVAPSAIQFPCTRVTAGGTTTNGYIAGEIAAGETVAVPEGVYNSQLQQFEYITAIRVVTPVPPPPATVTVQGLLAAAPSQMSAPSTLCLKNARVINTAMTPQVAMVSPCPAGQLPVYVIGTTRIVRRYGDVANLADLHLGDTLQVSGAFINTQFTASLVRDLSTHPAYTTVLGTIEYISFSTKPAYFVIRVKHHAYKIAKVITVYVQPGTRIAIDGSTTNQVSALNPGQKVTVVGVYDRGSHSFSMTASVRVQ